MDTRIVTDEVPAARSNAVPATDRQSGDSLSMHADVPVWCDCCSCEAEPYWVEAFGSPDDEESES
jgi:hypothetical protein